MVSLVLLGAGASHGSLNVRPIPPPLGNGPVGLFACLEEYSPLFKDLPDGLRQEFRENFEQGMASFYKYANGNIMAFQRGLAAYLAQFTPGSTNAYRTLIEKLGVHRVVYSTLNYDLLFELSAASLGLDTHYGVTTSSSHVRLLKPHGSCNFWPDIPVDMFKGLTVSNSGNADVSAPVRPLNHQQTMDRCVKDDSFAPAIAMYAEGKAVKVCPEYVKEQQNYWSATAANARHVFVSGVRVHGSDVHIWNVLAKSLANVTYFGMMGDKDEFLAWKEASAKRNAYFIESDFSSAIMGMKSRLT